ncbi:LOW QUALITY PROTEIN: uncharacterized protein LOC126298614 [Schistocerca gregaria]|uniref:LOW QUALITY PROTEIN: uncharacterized protein LOC126298614 n=1 Tax=Schistocerca gregaria TaxID=7010 RepID=UPI00211DF777|nr:LOW QUALITY PROTEIN: uncharacterized protein LOC126298614 [Schistocerca gregaria]
MRFVFFTALLLAFCPNHGKVRSAVVPGYLDFDNLPDTNFSCDGKVIGGYYADVETGCQMFHVCTIGQKGEITDIKFLCLNGTVFDQETRVCERVDEVDCSKTEGFYDLNLELYGNNAALSYHETEEDPVTIPTVSSTPSTTTTTTTTTTTAPTTAQLSLGLGLGRTPASTHYSSTPSPSVAAALLSLHSALSRDRHPHPHLTVQGGGSSGVLNPADAFQPLKTSAEPQQFVFSSTSPASLPVSAHTTSAPPGGEPPQLLVGHYQPAHHIFTTPSVAIVSSTRSVSSVKGVVGKLAPAAVAEGHSRVPINNFAFGINAGLNPPQFSAGNATAPGRQLPELDPYGAYHEADDESLDSFFRDVPRIAKQPKQVQRQKRATGRGGRGRFRPSLDALKEESGEEGPSPEGSEVFPQEAAAPRADVYFQKRPKARGRPDERRRRPQEDALPTAEAFFRSTRIGQLQQAATLAPTRAYAGPLVTEQPNEVQTTTPATETTMKPRAATQQLPYGRANEVDGGVGGRRTAAGSRGYPGSRRAGPSPSPSPRAGPSPSPSPRAGPSPSPSPRAPACRRGAACADQRSPYQAVLAEVSRGRPAAARQPEALATQTSPAPEPAAATATARSELQTTVDADVSTAPPDSYDSASPYSADSRRPSGRGQSQPDSYDSAGPYGADSRRSSGRGQSQPDSYESAGSYSADSRRPSGRGQSQPDSYESAGPYGADSRRSSGRSQAPPETYDSASLYSADSRRPSGRSLAPPETYDSASLYSADSRRPSGRGQSQPDSYDSAGPYSGDPRRPAARVQQPTPASRQRSRSRSQQVEPAQRRTPPASSVLRLQDVLRVGDVLRAGDYRAAAAAADSIARDELSCADKVPGGYYADVEADCQLFHICSQGRHGKITDNKFMCGPGTRFNQQSRTCQAREFVDCSISTSLYHLNNHFQPVQQEDMNDEPGFEPLKVRRSKRQAEGAARSPDYMVDSLPETSFTCEDKPSEGLYADVETQCQGFHLCQKVKGVMTLVSTFVCPHKTVFNQREGNCDNWADVDCRLYSQPEHSFIRKQNRKHTHNKRDTSQILKALDLFTYSSGESDNLKQNISSKIHSFSSRSKNNATSTPIAAGSLLRYSKPSKTSSSENKFEQRNRRKWMKMDLKLDFPPTTPSFHKRIKHEVTDESNETEEEYYDYIDDSYEADLVLPEEENSNLTAYKDSSKFEPDYSTHLHSNNESIDTVTTDLAHASSDELLIADSNKSDTDSKGTITTLPSVSRSSNSQENVKICAENDTCDYKDELEHITNKEGTVASSNHTHNTETSLHSAEEQLAHFPSKNNKTSAPYNDEYEYYDYYIEDIEDESDEIINYPIEQTTVSGLAHDSKSSPDVNISIPHSLTSTEKSNSSTTELTVSYTKLPSTDTNASDAEDKYNLPAVEIEEELEITQNKHLESSFQKATSEHDGENSKHKKSESIPVTESPEISLEEPISLVDEKYDYYDSDSNDDDAQLNVTYKEVLNMNFGSTERSQKDISDAKKENVMHQHSTEAINETSSYEDVKDVTETQVPDIEHLKLPEVTNFHEERTDHSTTLPPLLDHGHKMDMDLFSGPNVLLENGLPVVLNTTLDVQNTGNLVSENVAQFNASSLPQYTEKHIKESDENNNQFQNPLQNDGKEAKRNSSSENTTLRTTTSQGTSTLQIPNLFHPPKPHLAYHGRHSTPLLPPVVIRSKDGANHKSRVRNNRHKMKKTQNDEIHTTETFIKSENDPIISVSDNYFSTDKELIPNKDEITSTDSTKNTGNMLRILGTVNEFKVEQKTEPIFQQDSSTHPEESITVVPSTEIALGQAVLENDFSVKTDGLDSCKGNAGCLHVQSQYTTLSPLSYKFHNKHTDHLSHVSQTAGFLSEHTEKNLQQPNSLEQSTFQKFKGSEGKTKSDEQVLGTDIPPTSSGNTVDYVTITPKVQSLKDASETVTTESLFPTYTLSAINAQTNQKSNHDSSRFVCSSKELYRYYPDPLDCRIFHYCSHGFHNQQVLDFRFMCENGTAFSTDTQKCENEEEVQSCSMTKK